MADAWDLETPNNPYAPVERPNPVQDNAKPTAEGGRLPQDGDGTGDRPSRIGGTH